MARLVRFNVGGKDFTTSLSTLQTDPDSMLATMVNGFWGLDKIKSGQVLFIDRDPTYFAHVLNFLRDGPNFCLPKNEYDLIRIKTESEFYQLNGLKRLANKNLRAFSSSKNWVPKIGDTVQWKESTLECFSSIFFGFINGSYISPMESMMITKRQNENLNLKRYRIIDTGSVYEINASEYECFVCDEPAYLKITKKAFKQASTDNNDDDNFDYQKKKAQFLMCSIQGEIEELFNGTCAVVKWMVKTPIFCSAFINDLGQIQTCKTRTTKIHLPVSALTLQQ